MKKIIVSIFLVLIFLSGCTFKSDQELSEKVAKLNFDRIKKEYFDFNEEDFEIKGNRASGPTDYFFRDLVTYYNYTPQNQKYLKINADWGIGIFVKGDKGTELSPLFILNRYYTSYVYNNFIIDRKLGNKLDEMFIELEKQEVKYYIQDPTYYEELGYYDYPTFDHVFKVKKESSTVLKPGLEKIPRSKEEIDEYIKSGINVTNPTDMRKYMQFMNFYPVINVDIYSEKYGQDDLDGLIEWAKQFYNSDEMLVRFTSEKQKIDGKCVETPPCSAIGGIDFKGKFTVDLDDNRFLRRNHEYDETKVRNTTDNNSVYEDPEREVYKWNEVPK